MSASTGTLIIYCGGGKGKTTSAIGLAIRAAGHGMSTSFIQFMKSQSCGEHRALARLADVIDVHLMGSGFVFRSPPPPEAVEAAGKAMALVRENLVSGKYSMVVADEILAALAAGLVELKEVEALADIDRGEVTLVFTGREAPPSLVERADLVSRIEAVKHPYDKGMEARAGIEF